MIIRPARRTENVQEYYFSRKLKEIGKMNSEREALGADAVINLGIGSPDGMPPQEAVAALCACAQQSASHGYQSYTGIPELRKAFSEWYAVHYGVHLDPDTEIQPLAGSKEGILLISMAFLDPSDKVLVPDPGYPTYTSASRLTGADVFTYNLKEENGWMPDFDELEELCTEDVKILWTNYPHMPTGAPASMELYSALVDFAIKHGILVCNDNPYSFILNDRPLSIFSVPRAKECCLELNSLSKAHNMAGWRIGMLAGEPELVAQVLKVKSQMDSGMFRPMQLAAAEALSRGSDWFRSLNDEYRLRKIAAGRIFDLVGAEYDRNSCGMFLWGRVLPASPFLRRTDEGRMPDAGERPTAGQLVSDRILHEAGVFITPGFIFGKNGSSYLRISLCADVPALERAADKIASVMERINTK